jgi:hypothetical protein
VLDRLLQELCDPHLQLVSECSFWRIPHSSNCRVVGLLVGYIAIHSHIHVNWLILYSAFWKPLKQYDLRNTVQLMFWDTLDDCRLYVVLMARLEK